MRYTKPITYVLKFELSTAPQYKWTACGKCINIRTGRVIRKVVNGRSVGYCISGKFKSLSTLRKQIRKLNDKDKAPF